MKLTNESNATIIDVPNLLLFIMSSESYKNNTVIHLYVNVLKIHPEVPW